MNSEGAEMYVKTWEVQEPWQVKKDGGESHISVFVEKVQEIGHYN